LAKPNFQYEKRQKELEKKRKKEEKLKRKAEKGISSDDSAGAAESGLTPVQEDSEKTADE
jgi:hypothetical protein